MTLSRFSHLLLSELDMRIRDWQDAFILKCNRNPTKNDIDEAKMATIYKKYQKLKKLKKRGDSKTNAPKNPESLKTSLNPETKTGRTSPKNFPRRLSFGFAPTLNRSLGNGPKEARNPPEKIEKPPETEHNEISTSEKENEEHSFVIPGNLDKGRKSSEQPRRRFAAQRLKDITNVLSNKAKTANFEENSSQFPEKEALELIAEIGLKKAEIPSVLNRSVCLTKEQLESSEVPETSESELEPKIERTPLRRKSQGETLANRRHSLGAGFLKSQPVLCRAGGKKLNVSHRQSFNLKKTSYKRKRVSGVMPSNRRRSFYSKKSRKIFALEKLKLEAEKNNDNLYCDTLSLKQLKKTTREISESERQFREESSDVNEKLEKNKNGQKLAKTDNEMAEQFAKSTERVKAGRLSLEAVLEENFGIERFRAGQKEVVELILRGESSLAIMPTGSGKSLCFQLPALLIEGVALVVTPLISLMQNHLKNLPASLRGAVWSSCQTPKEILGLIESLNESRVDVLFISPERLSSPSFVKIMQNLPSPGISFVCVDEAHCVSDWSHNFRPCYLQLNKAIREDLGVKTVLALTATATIRTKLSVCDLLRIDSKNVIEVNFRRNNLNLTSSNEPVCTRFKALVALLNSQRFRYLSSIIIYVSTRAISEDLAGSLRANGFDALGYNAGMSALRRRRTQTSFMRGKTRVIVATVAFGMGVNKKDVRGVIHYNAPNTIENYIQEIGRAGRDKNPAECHCFFSDEDFERQRSLAMSNSMSRDLIGKIICALFEKLKSRKKGSFAALNLDEISDEFDVSQNVVETVLTKSCGQTDKISLIGKFHSVAKIGFLVDPKGLGEEVELVKFILDNSVCKNGTYRIKIEKLLNELELNDISETQKILISLKWEHKISLKWEQLAFFVNIRSAELELPAIAKNLHCKMSEFEDNQLLKRKILSQSLKYVSAKNMENAKDHMKMLDLAEKYFQTDDPGNFLERIENSLPPIERLSSLSPVGIKEVEKDILNASKRVVNFSEDLEGNALAITRILHGISSNKHPASMWKKHPSWKRFVHYPFKQLSALLQNHILAICKNLSINFQNWFFGNLLFRSRNNHNKSFPKVFCEKPPKLLYPKTQKNP